MIPCKEQEPIAIIGAACRLPGEATSLGGLWDMISHGRSAHGKVPPSRWDADTWYHPDPDRKGSISVKHGYFLEQDVSLFDAPFFSMTAKEAAGMDPMKRLLLEVSYEGFESAGVLMDDLMNSQTGVYVGCMTNDYEQLSTHDIYDIGDVAASGMSEAMTANRVSWFFGLRGPSLTLDTACSSSLYALHLACQSLKSGETKMGLVAGVNLILHPNFMHQLSSMHMLSPEGISHSFDHRANGYGRGEGIGCLVLKRLKDALRDGDTIRAVIRGTGTNADGKTPGITQPSSEAQAELIRTTYEAAGLSLSDTQYFEAHGTGTALGDPIELSAIGAILGAARSPETEPLYVGSIKANVGHTEGCSGLAGVLKSILCLEKGVLIPTAGIEKLNPKLKLRDWNLALPSENMAWPSKGQRRISVNSFGFGGANAHVILDDAYHYLRNRGLVGNHATAHLEDDSSESGISMGSDSPRQEDSKRLFVLSTRDQTGIERLAPLYADFLSNKAATSSSRFLTDLVHTLSNRRTHLDFRSFAVADSSSVLETQLRKGLPRLKRVSKHDNPIFVFTGQGAQWPAMGKELLNNCIFRTSIHRSQVLLEHYGCPWDLVDELSRTTNSNVDLPQYSQVLCTVLQIALVDLLREWGVVPKAVVGHSSGEIGAAYAAGLLSRCNAVKVAYLRGVCSGKVADHVSPHVGAMAAAGLSEEEAAKYVEQVALGSVVVACVNSPSSVTLSGDRDAVTQLCEQISADGKFARMLRVKTAYHSPHMATVAQEYMDRMGVLFPLAEEDQVAHMFSSLTGTTVTARDLDASYWKKNMCEQVQFSQAMKTLLDYVPEQTQGRGRNRIHWSAFVEIGPHAALQSPVAEVIKISQSKAAKEAPYFSAIIRGKDSEVTALELAGQLWGSGHNVNLSRVNYIYPESLPTSLPDLPSYPWNHSRGYWHESATARSSRFPRGPRTDLLGVPVDLQNAMEPRWRNYLRILENPWIEDHKITGTVLYPAAGMIVMAMEAAHQLRDTSKHLNGITFRDLKFERGLVVTSREQAVQTEVSLRPDDTRSSTWAFAIYSTQAGGSWTRHCHGALSLEYASNGNHNPDAISNSEWATLLNEWGNIQKNAIEEVDMETFYDELEVVGVDYGPTFRNVFQAGVVSGEHCAHGSIRIPDTKSTMPFNYEFPHLIHPATMDAIFHLLFIAFSDGKPLEEAAVPYTLKHMYVSTNLPQGHGSVYKGYAKRLRTSGRETSGDLVVSDEACSSPKLIAHDFALRQVTSSQESSTESDHSSRRVCAKLCWKEDVDFISSPASLRSMVADQSGFPCNSATSTALSILLDRLHHKRPDYKMLIVMQDATEATRDSVRALLDPLNNGTNWRLRKTFIASAASNTSQLLETLSTEEQGQIELREWQPSKQEGLPFNNQIFDIMIVWRAPTTQELDLWTMSTLRESLAPMGLLGVVAPDHKGLSSFTELESLIAPAGLSTTAILSDEDRSLSLLLARKLASANPAIKPSEVFLLCKTKLSSGCQQLEQLLKEGLRLFGCEAKSASLSDAEQLKGKHVISLLEVESPLVNGWTETEFTQFKRLVSGVTHMLWVTKGGLLENWNGGLEFAPSQGLLRVMRTEYSRITMPHLDLNRSEKVESACVAKTILDVWSVSVSGVYQQPEMEYAERDGAIFVPRFIEDDGMDTSLDLQDGLPKPVQGTLCEETQWKLTQTDEQLIWVEEEIGSRTLGDGEVEIEVDYVVLQKASGILQETDQQAYQTTAVSGIILGHSSTAKSVETRQRVVALYTGPCCTKIIASEGLVRVLPPSIDSPTMLETAVALFAAHYALVEAARLERGQTVLVHGAESSLGQAALQRSQMAGAEVFVTIKDPVERHAICQKFGLGRGRVFESASKTCVADVLRQTQGRGADIILNCGQDELTSNLFGCLGEFGTFVDLNPGQASKLWSTPPSRQNATFVTANASRLLEARPALAQRIWAEVFELIEDGKISFQTPGLLKSIADIGVVTPQRREDEDRGLEVLHVDRNAKVTLLPSKVSKLSLDADGTYVLAGGLGALGLQIAEMMFQHEAGHVVFLSRSGGEKNQADLESFRQRGLRVDALKCDVSDAPQVENAVRRLQSDGRHIKGVIQCAMDAIFENMTYEQWQKSTRPKIQGTMNLHNHMPSNLDFFILLSSITCVIGNAAQSNYAAGNTFEDALAHFRRSQGLAATAIDVGLVTDSAHFTGDFDMNAYFQMYEHRWDGLQTTQPELDAVLRAAMAGRTADGQPVEPQIVLGLGSSMPVGPSSALWTKDPKFSHRVNHLSSERSDASIDAKSAKERMSQVGNLQDATQIVEGVLRGYAAQIMDINIEDVDVEKAFYDFGVDSLKAVELRNRIFRELESDVSVFELLSPSPLSKLSVGVASRSKLVAQYVGKTDRS
ncbi:PKSN polyketide synthase for alternapyrone biosynthesis protein [Colletotrichum higginsianum]|uniref:PKSN polyketide synthase for alternapyrone biosynthesis protein n=1 Tax=Colletotrichum higginsianum (strain IMI 349063) TaxID=759273 RepID=H1V5W1_COLHI|nr:PKSN polyketide synthase for alternapyrone biosynthesis protein [Colletotrichum higginsianum IMI 349063]OBR02689.1 PKSN polyketide synthase for alternapyrone biosynthesis protein [Colletotrichum higginsianum IMI 349063]CCF35613.1 PKSN polyketide synthase for alternapyrone biosynthesis protein [Colletotrichum higginsianum]